MLTASPGLSSLKCYFVPDRSDCRGGDEESDELATFQFQFDRCGTMTEDPEMFETWMDITSNYKPKTRLK